MQIPTLAIGLIEGLTFKGKCYSGLAQMLGTRSITERLAHLLLHLVDTYGVEDANGILIGAAFTHADLAHMVGATRQWITISLKRLQDQGVVTCRKSRIVVRRLDVLEEMRGQGRIPRCPRNRRLPWAAETRSGRFWATNRPRWRISVCPTRYAAQR